MTTNILQGPKLDYTPNGTLGQFFFDLAVKHKDRLCQVDVVTGKSQTFFEINQKSTRVALSLSKLGVTPSDVIITCATSNINTPVAVLGALYLGAKVTNLDVSMSVRQASHLLSLVSPKVIFVDESCVGLIEESLDHCNLQAEIVVIGSSNQYPTFSSFTVAQTDEEAFRPAVVDLAQNAIMFFSSGTTGLPKAICHSHRSFLNLIHSFYKSGMDFDTTIVFTSFYWISAMLLLSCSFAAGGCRLISVSTQPEQIFRCIEKYKVTFVLLTPNLFPEVTTYANYKQYDTSSLQSILTGGSPVSATQLRKVSNTFENSTVIYGYGLSEVGIATFLDPVADRDLFEKKVGSSGKPRFGFVIKVVDVSTNEPLGPHRKGEICIKTPSMMTGYYKDDCSQNFDPDGFLKTGDMGYYDEDGCFYIVDRMKEMFKYLMWHIVPSFIESVILEHPDVKEAVVFGLPASDAEGELPTACVVLRNGRDVTPEDIGEFVANRVSDKEKLRGGVHFIQEIFRTPTGKVARKETKNFVMRMLKEKRGDN